MCVCVCVLLAMLFSPFTPFSLPPLYPQIRSLHLCIPSLQTGSSISFLDSIYMHKYTIFIFHFLTCFSLYIRFSFIYLTRTGSNSLFFCGLVVSPCMYVSHLYPFICILTSRLLPCLGDCKPKQ